MTKFGLALLTLIVIPAAAIGAIEQFVETFRGTGPFSSLDGTIVGFDNPGWILDGNGSFVDGGFRFENRAFARIEKSDADIFSRSVSGLGSFVETITISEPEFGEFVPLGNGASNFTLSHQLAPRQPSMLSLIVGESDDDDTDWYLGIRVGSSDLLFFDVHSGPDVFLSIEYDHEESQAVFSFDNNLSDEILAISFGPYDYDGLISERQRSEFSAIANEFPKADGMLINWTLLREAGIYPGDFNKNGNLDVADLDLLTVAIRSGENTPIFDLGNDTVVDQFDRVIWVKNLAKTWFGDSNLDGEFNSSDLVAVFGSGEYDDDVELNSTWTEGDWDGNGEFNSRDLVIAFQDGGYEVGPRDVIKSVPEATNKNVLFAIVVLGTVTRIGRRTIR